MNAEKSTPAKPHSVSINERRQLVATGVSKVDSFNEEAVVAYTDQGQLCVRGSGLHINKLNAETGELSITGEITLLSYTENHKGNSLLSRLFR